MGKQKSTDRRHAVMVRMNDDEFAMLQAATGHFRNGLPGMDFTQSDVLRFALTGLVQLMRSEAFMNGVRDRFAMEPEPKTSK